MRNPILSSAWEQMRKFDFKMRITNILFLGHPFFIFHVLSVSSYMLLDDMYLASRTEFTRARFHMLILWSTLLF